jgi:hypothetical protein
VITAQKPSRLSSTGITRRRTVTKYLPDIAMGAALMLVLSVGVLQWGQVRGYLPDIGMAIAIVLLLSLIWAAPHVLRWVSDEEDKKEDSKHE